MKRMPIPTPKTGRKRLVSARKRRDKAKKGTTALSKARADVRRAEKALRMAHERKAICQSAYQIKRRKR